MNHSAGEHPEALSTNTVEFLEDDEAAAEEEAEAPRAARTEQGSRAARLREGLPDGFRMRHDAHYVDELTSTAAPPSIRYVSIAQIDADAARTSAEEAIEELAESVTRHGVLQPVLIAPARGRFRMIDGGRRLRAAALAGLRHVPCIVHDVDEAAAEEMRSGLNAVRAMPVALIASEPLGAATLRDLASRLEAVSGQAVVCANATPPFRSIAASDALLTEAARATRIARAAAVLLEMPRLARRELTARDIAERSAAATALPRRLAGVTLDLSIDDPDFRVPVDSALIGQALAGTIDAMLAILEDAMRSDDNAAGGSTRPNARLMLTVRCVKVRPAAIIELSQSDAGIAPELAARFFDASSDLHPGGPASALLLAAAARIVRAHGGRADVRRDGELGATVTLVLPRSTCAPAAS